MKQAVIFMLFAGLLLFLNPAFSEETAKEIKKYCKIAESSKDISERAGAVRRLTSFLPDPLVYKTFKKILKKEKESAVLIEILEVCNYPCCSELYHFVYPHIFSSDIDVAILSAKSISGMNREQSIRDLVKQGKSKGDEAVASIRALGRILKPQEAVLLCEFLKPSIPENAAVAIAALMKLGSVEHAEKVCSLLTATSAIARNQAAQAASFFRYKDAVPNLIKLLAREDSATVARKALKDLTSNDFGEDYRKWFDWWKFAESSFTSPEFKFLENNSEVSFFEHKVTTRRFCVMMDYSDSMGSGKGSSLEAQRNEVIRLVTELTPNMQFNAVSYSRSAGSFVPVAVEADFVNKARFFSWLRTCSTDIYTSTYDGFKLSLGIRDLCTLFFSGNGIPNWGDLPNGTNTEIEDNVAQAVRKLRKENNLKVSIYSVAFPFAKDMIEDSQDTLFPNATGRSFDSRAEGFFRLIAALNDGKYCFINISQRVDRKKE